MSGIWYKVRLKLEPCRDRFGPILWDLDLDLSTFIGHGLKTHIDIGLFQIEPIDGLRAG